ncbi:MAG: TIGR03790 family protein [Opitutales bacterium]|nr:TIGR03790 family protein [Opitutales bacterium]
MKFWALIFSIFVFVACGFAKVSKEKIFVVVNANSADSKAIANYYCEVRSIPKENIITLNIPDKDVLSRAEYQKKLANPLVAELAKRKVVSADVITTDSNTHRPNYLFISHDIDFVVLCKLPFKVAPFSKSRGFATDASSVDSELSATFLQMKKMNGPLRNPLYKNYSPESIHKTYGVLRVARLDGKNFDEAKSIIDSALTAEKNGIRGRAYIDKNTSKGGYKIGNDWLSSAEETLKKMNFDISVDSVPALMGYEKRFDFPAFFFGWYNGTPQSYFIEKGFKSAEGGVGLHLYSFSASYLRRSGWTSVMMNNAFAQTYGNVYEPYLTGTQDISAIMKAYENGLTAGEVAYASIAILSWQTLVVGDPLYNPFAVSLDEQMKRIDNGEVDKLSQYVVLRQSNKMKADGISQNACDDFVKKYIGKMPDVALVWRMIESAITNKNNEVAEKYVLELHAKKIWSDIQYVGLSMELASVCEKIAMAELGMDIYNKLGELNLSKKFMKTLVREASKLSKKSGVKLSEKFAEMKKLFDAEDAEAKRIAEEKKKQAEATKQRRTKSKKN